MFCMNIYGKLLKILLSEFHLPETISSRASSNKKLLSGQFFEKSIVSNDVALGNVIYVQSRYKVSKSRLDYSKVPKLEENDLSERYVRGSGPGGQAVAKTNNAVVLTHKPTGIVVKCHETRSLWDNKKRAREILLTKLDNMLNGQESIESQEKKILAKKSANMMQKKAKMSALQAAFKEREGID